MSLNGTFLQRTASVHRIMLGEIELCVLHTIKSLLSYGDAMNEQPPKYPITDSLKAVVSFIESLHLLSSSFPTVLNFS